MKFILSIIVILISSVSFATKIPMEFISAGQKLMIFAEGGPSSWKAGDTLTYKMRIKPIPVVAKAELKIAKIDNEGALIVETISYSSFKITIENLLDKDTGETKKITINGKEQKIPATNQGMSKIVIEEEAHLKVEAGEYDCIHLVTEDAEGNRTQAWINPSQIPISGLLKSSIVQGFATVEMELKSFAFGH